ncbi:hypothetical protein PINS_up023452 [Pythium insidiosum]|nr:hypothetical protein PINS_up023452 [Pythium insidiosum]
MGEAAVGGKVAKLGAADGFMVEMWLAVANVLEMRAVQAASRGSASVTSVRLAKAVFPTRHTSTAFPCVLAFCKRVSAMSGDQTSGSISGPLVPWRRPARDSSGAHLAAEFRRTRFVSPPESTKSTSSMAATDATFSFFRVVVIAASAAPPQLRSTAQSTTVRRTGGLANPSAAATAMPSAVPDERQRLMERLLQANMTAEATYLLAKYSSNLAQQSADNNR